jgi:hypothetical protein
MFSHDSIVQCEECVVAAEDVNPKEMTTTIRYGLEYRPEEIVLGEAIVR